MRAVAKLAQAAASVGVIDAAEPIAGPGEVLIRVAAAGICGTDMAIYNWAPRMRARVAPPRILGHEATGRIEAIGQGVADLKVGDAAPDFALKGSDGKTYKLSDYKGNQAVVIAWFPKAFTGG